MGMWVWSCVDMLSVGEKEASFTAENASLQFEVRRVYAETESLTCVFSGTDVS